MRYRRLGSTDLPVSVIGVGTWQFGGEWGKSFTTDEVKEMFAAAGEAGINLIDTAECYGDHESERLTGTAISGQRDRWIIASKFGHKFHGYMNRTEPRTPADVVEQTEASLRALQTDYLDIQQYHSWGDSQFFQDDVMESLLRLRSEGKIRYLGNSIGNNQNVRQIGASRERQISVIQIVYNYLSREPEGTTFPLCVEQDLGVLARVPLASGMLSGKYEPGHVFPGGDVRSRKRAMAHGDETHRAIERARAESPHGTELATFALAWCLQHPAVSAVIPGCKSVAQVQANAKAAELTIVDSRHPQAMA